MPTESKPVVQRGGNQATVLKLAKTLIYKTFDF